MTYMENEISKNPTLALTKGDLEKMSKKELIAIRSTFTQIPIRSSVTKKDLINDVWGYICDKIRTIDMNRRLSGGR